MDIKVVPSFGGRKELFRALVGSHNYNLNTESSDKDYKVFVCPTFDDLYFNNQFSKCYISDTEDLDCHDVRKLTSLLWKSNVNFVEVLFSKEIELNGSLSELTKSFIASIFKSKNYIARMNLPYLYNACVGMHITKKKQLDKGTEGTRNLVEKYGYDTKQAMHSYRILDFLVRYADTNFNDFSSAIEYKDNSKEKEFILSIKNGKYTKEEFLVIVNKLFEEVEEKYKAIYSSMKIDEDTNNNLLCAVKEIVKTEIF